MNSKASITLIWGNGKGNDISRKLFILVYFKGCGQRRFPLGGKLRITKDEFDRHRGKAWAKAWDEVKPAYSIAEDIIDKLNSHFTLAEFCQQYRERVFGVKAPANKTTFYDIGLLYISSKPITSGTASAYSDALRRMKKYKDLPIDLIDDSFAKAFYDKLASEISINTTRMYFRAYRAIFGWAIQKGYTQSNNPFSKMEDRPLASIRKKPIALSDDEREKLKAYQPQNKKEEFALDFFFAQMEFCGPNGYDVLTLRKKAININDSSISFVRKKTMKRGHVFSVPLTGTTRAFIEKYGMQNVSPESYIFPFISQDKEGKALDTAVHDFMQKHVNAPLKRICESIGIRVINSPVSRHTVATKLAESFPIGVVSGVLGHTSTLTTQSYLDSLSPKKIEEVGDAIHELFSRK